MRQRSMTIVGIFDLGLGEAEKSLVFINSAYSPNTLQPAW